MTKNCFVAEVTFNVLTPALLSSLGLLSYFRRVKLPTSRKIGRETLPVTQGFIEAQKNLRETYPKNLRFSF